ncbi:hypothetical protein ACP70R_026707 [Stipagrostis hirtigluma subsp. patula]
MADNGGNHLANGAVPNGGDHAAGAAANGGNHLANGAAPNGGDHAAGVAANGAVANGGNDPANGAAANGGDHAAGVAANGAAENGGDPHHAPAAAAGNGAVGNGNAAPAPAPAPAFWLIPEALLYQLVLHMPAAMVARFRASSTRWRELTSTEEFRHAHHVNRSRCPMPLFFYRLGHQAVPLDNHVRVHLRAVDIGRRESFEVLRFAHLGLGLPIIDPRVFRIEGSCDGILLLSYHDRLYACNPCTRRWTRLPALHRIGDIVGFYHTEGPVGGREYRVLYHVGRQDADCMYSILSFPENGQRPIGRPANVESLVAVLACGICPSFEMPPVVVGRFLHWRPQVDQFSSYLVVFDTVDELFQWLRPPRTFEVDRWAQVEGEHLLELNGSLAMIAVEPMFADVWVLQDYVTQIWAVGYRIDLPVAAIAHNHGYDDELALLAAVFAVSQEQNALVQCARAILQTAATGAVRQAYRLAGNCTVLSRYMLQESLLLHAFLPLGPGDAHDGDPPFFQAP